MSAAEDQQTTLEIIVSQLKSYGFYSLAKGISDQAKLGNVEASNQLQQLIKANVVKQEKKQDIVVKQGGLDFNSKKTTLNPNYKSRFQTQHRGPGRATAFSPDGNFIATGSQDTTLKVLDVHAIREFQNGMEDKRVLKTLYDHTGPVNEVAFHPNGAVLASCSDDGMIKFYDLEKKNSKKGFKYLADVYPVRSISFHPSGEFILSGTDHHAVRLYEIANMKCYIPSSNNDHHQGAITKVRYSPNGGTFATCSIDGSIKIFDTITSKCINTIDKAHDGASVTGIEWSSSGAYLLSTGLDSIGRLWDLNSGKVVVTYIGGLQKFDHAPLVFSHNEDYVVGPDAASHSICIWNTISGELMRKVKSTHEDTIHTIAASPVDLGLFTVGEDCRGRYWNTLMLGKMNKIKQSEEEKREIRNSYRELSADTKDSRPMLLQEDQVILNDKIKRADALFSNVRAASEAVLDAEFLVGLSEIAVEKARKLQMGQATFEVADYIGKLKQLIENDEEHWNCLNEPTKEICHLVPTSGFMFGPISIDVKEKVKKVSAKLVKSAIVNTAQQVDGGNQALDPNETSHNVKMIFDLLEDLEPINFFKFVIHPQSFSQTVENIFYLSFLIRDAKAYVHTDDNNNLILETAEPPSPEQLQDPELIKMQNILHLDMATWRKMIMVHGITEPSIPNRQPVADAFAETWQ